MANHVKMQSLEDSFVGWAVFHKDHATLSPNQAVVAYFPIWREQEAKDFISEFGGKLGYVGGRVDFQLAFVEEE